MNYKILLPVCFLLLNIAGFAQKNIAVPATLSLNGKWQFETDSAGIGEDQHWYAEQASAFNDELTVPGNWNIENRYAAYTGKAWYKKTVFIPSVLKGKLIRLYFEGVYNIAKVWVNGKFIMENNLGYLQFEKDVSGLLLYGKTNTIVVCADNHFKLGALWNWGGIRRPVKLLINNPLYIAQNHITPKVNLGQHTARVNFDLSIFNTSARYTEAEGRIEVFREGRSLKKVQFNNTIGPDKKVEQKIDIDLNHNELWLWSLDDPQLYSYKITLIKNKKIIDEYKGHFGLRVIELDKANKQLRLNGKVIRPLGFNLVPDDRTTGNTLPLWRVKEDVDMMKSMGANVARMSHMPYHQELLDYLDEKGMLIFEEIPVWGDNNSMVKKDNPVTNEWLRRMINDHYNHPCIAGWSVGNEIGKNKDVMAYTDAAIKLVKQLDTTRLGVTVSYTGANATDPLQLSDIGFMNSYGRTIHRAADHIHAVHPQSVLFLSEFGLGQLNEDLATDFPIQTMMDSLRMKPFLIGASLWTFNDYRSTYKDTKEASQNRPWGLVDVSRQKKAAFYSFRKANMPVAAFQVNVSGLIENGKVSVNIKPRAVFDLPANELDGYRVVLKLMDKTGQLTGGDVSMLPVVHPGDQPFSLLLNSKKFNAATFNANISLLSPQNYVMYDTVIYFKKPLLPRVLYAASGVQTVGKASSLSPVIQVRFEKDGSAAGYKLRYHEAGEVKETPLTTNNYINLVNTATGQVSQMELVAVNDVGEIETQIPAIKSQSELLAPLIRYTEATDDGFFIEMETTADDRTFIVQTTDNAGDYNKATITMAQTKGALKVSGLINGKTYYYRIKRAGSKGESGWSEEVVVKPDGGLIPVKPIINGIIKDEKNAIICFEPVKKSTGYDLLYKCGNEKNWHHIVIDAAQIDQYQFKLTGAGKIEVKLAAINTNGRSEYSMFSL